MTLEAARLHSNIVEGLDCEVVPRRMPANRTALMLEEGVKHILFASSITLARLYGRVLWGVLVCAGLRGGVCGKEPPS